MDIICPGCGHATNTNAHRWHLEEDATPRTEEEIVAEGQAVGRELLAADRRGDALEVARLHKVMNDLTKEVFALWE